MDICIAMSTVAECGRCHAKWDDKLDPSPGALCHYCHGRGHSTAEIEPPSAVPIDDIDQVRTLLT